jgi:hypothetical protein
MFEKGLGKKTIEVAKAVIEFDPGNTGALVESFILDLYLIRCPAGPYESRVSLSLLKRSRSRQCRRAG